MTFLEVAEAVLKEAKTPLNYREMWEHAKIMGLDKELGSESKMPEKIMRNRIYADIVKSDSVFYISNKRPKTFWLIWLKSRQTEIIGKETEIEQKRQEKYEKELKDDENKKDFQEKDLHPLLVRFLANEQFGLYCKTINAGSSKKKSSGLGVWNHPDIVGVHFPFNDYNGVAFELLSHTNQLNYKI